MATRALSYSAATTWRECEQRYWYRYEDKIRPKTFAPALTLGNWIHSYMERYYKAVRRGIDTDTAHNFGIEKTTEQYADELAGMASTAETLGQGEVAQEFRDMAPSGARMCERYYNFRGREDSERYDIILVEERIRSMADANVRVNGIIDLVVRDLDRGVIQMWDHKSTKRPPRADSHLLDLQLVLYAAMLHEQNEIEADELVWNYIRTVEPTKPEPMKNGKLSKARNIDTDYHTYLAAIVEHGLLPDDYADVLTRLAGREETTYFPRHALPFNTAGEEVIIGDFIRTAYDIQMATTDADYNPVRNIGRSCSWCDYKKICTAVVTGGDITEVIERNFERG